jgi:hypothetical protein
MNQPTEIGWKRTWPMGAQAPALGDSAAWVRLVPAWGPGAAVLWKSAPSVDHCSDCGFRNAESRLTIDRKLIPPFDLMDAGFGPDLRCSERFVEALTAARANGWTAELQPHATPNSVAGIRLYRLTTEGRSGRVLSHAPPLCEACERPAAIRPAASMLFDSQGFAGHDVVWSTDWFGGHSKPWRALMVSRRVVDELIDRLGPTLAFGIVPIATTGQAASGRGAPGVVTGSDAGPGPSFDSPFDRVHAGRHQYDHRLLEGTDHSTIRERLGKLHYHPPPSVLNLYRQWNGASLFRGALDLAHLGSGDGSITGLNRLAKQSGYAGDGLFFGGSTYASMLWCIDEAGTVRGSGADGVTYGAGVPLDRWLDDQVKDLEFAWDNRDKVDWAADYARPAG